ncbi:MAG: hypothetical protein K0U70_12920 [Actinomycetia bacterium]|nr:hypothetical protein [Actinomycetes bacterium]MCH9708805.1 hypothetical protein [Actinomycetes bacterium]MCH9768690.1 hypothetical protein [Actinomycetes bacterium]
MSSRIWRRPVATALAGTVVAGGLVSGFTAPAALGQPSDSSTRSQETATQAQPRRVSPDQILMTISQDYQTGAGGGQISKLIDQVITLRKRGVRVSNSNAQALAAALDKRPNQKPLINALEGTLSDQRRQFARGGIQAPGGAPPVATPGSPHSSMGGGFSPGNPMDRDNPVFETPGR